MSRYLFALKCETMSDEFQITNRTSVSRPRRSCRTMSRLIRVVKYFIFATSFFIWEMTEVRSQIIDTETVTIKQGVLRGGSKLLNGHRIFTFLGVPYAEPPIGSRRLRPTSPHPGWTVSFLSNSDIFLSSSFANHGKSKVRIPR